MSCGMRGQVEAKAKTIIGSHSASYFSLRPPHPFLSALLPCSQFLPFVPPPKKREEFPPSPQDLFPPFFPHPISLRTCHLLVRDSLGRSPTLLHAGPSHHSRQHARMGGQGLVGGQACVHPLRAAAGAGVCGCGSKNRMCGECSGEVQGAGAQRKEEHCNAQLGAVSIGVEVV